MRSLTFADVSRSKWCDYPDELAADVGADAQDPTTM
jgi:hypothetical protein